MGWTYMRSLNGFATPKAYLDNQLTWSRDGVSSRVLKSTVVGKSVYYAAVERVAGPHLDRIVFAAICLVHHRPRARDGYIFGYKDQDETVGPYEKACPASILDLLTPTQSAYALEWREACRAAHRMQRAEAAKPTPRPGDIIVFAEPITFRNGLSLSRFRVVRHYRKPHAVLFVPFDGDGLYRISSVKRRAYTLTRDGAQVAAGLMGGGTS